MSEVVYQIAWWERSRFHPVNRPVCDYCSLPISIFPTPVLTDRLGADPHALCKKCMEESAIKEGDEEYFETIEYRVKLEAPEPGVNFGGRRHAAPRPDVGHARAP